MARRSERLIEAALDLAWSHWTGLGVRGTSLPPDTAIDPEALAYFTAILVPHDPRLRDEVIDWWSRHQHYVSRPRLDRLAPRFGVDAIEQLRAIDDAAGSSATTSGKSRLDRLDHPALALLRLRCLFGANARAEIMLALLTQPAGDGVTALALSEVGYTKRNVAMVLDDLRLSGIVHATADANRVRYRVADPESMRRALRPFPTVAGRWHVRLPILAAFVALAARNRGKDEMVQAVEARKVLAQQQANLDTLDLPQPQLASAAGYWRRLQDWLVEHVVTLPPDRSRAVPGMIEGIWLGPNDDLRKPDRFFSAVLPARAADPARSGALRCLDLVQVPTIEPPNDWTWVVLSEAGLHAYEHTIGLSRGERWRFVTWVDGDARSYEASLDEALAPDAIAARYGGDAAARARNDRPAVQLTLSPR